MVEAKSSKQRKHWRAWTGTVAQLRNLLELVEVQYAPLVAGYIQDSTRMERGEVEHNRALRVIADREHAADAAALESARGLETEGELQRLQDRLIRQDAQVQRYRSAFESAERLLEAAEEAARKGLDIELRLTNGPTYIRTYSGRSDEIVKALEVATFTSFSVSVQPGYRINHEITVEFAKTTGVDLTVSAADPRWAEAAFGALARELKNHAPWWGFVRSAWFAYPAFLVAGVMGGLLAVQGLLPTKNFVLLGLLVAYGAFILAFALTWLVHRFVPAVEIVAPGQRPRAVALVAIIIGFVAQIGLGLFVNLISGIGT